MDLNKRCACGGEIVLLGTTNQNKYMCERCGKRVASGFR